MILLETAQCNQSGGASATSETTVGDRLCFVSGWVAVQFFVPALKLYLVHIGLIMVF